MEGSAVAAGQRGGAVTIIPPEPGGNSGQPGQEPKPGHDQVEKQQRGEGSVHSYRRRNVREHPNRKRETHAIIKGQTEGNRQKRRQRQNV